MRKSLYDYCMETGKEYILEEWDERENLSLTAKDLSYGSSDRKVWWLCEKGHRWQASPYTRVSGSGCPYCKGRKVDAGDNDIESLFPELMKEWHPTKNKGISPGQLPPGSHRKVWWLCEKGHEWQAIIKSRTAGAGCPVCANRVILPGENDLATTHPDLALQWDPEKNPHLLPTEVAAGSGKKVWWRCEKGHSWQASITSRSSGCGCPFCAGKAVAPNENDLATAFPQIAAQWHPAKNGRLKPEGCMPSSNRKVWWLCPLGHAYQAVIAARTARNNGCPYCSGRKVLKGFNDLATLEPEIAAQWHPTLNGALTPEMVTPGTSRRIWWRCPEGHVWKAIVHSRTGSEKCGCPVCAGTVKRRKKLRYGAVQEEPHWLNGEC